MWLSQVLGHTSWAVLVPPVIPESKRWKEIVESGMRRRSGDGQGRRRIPIFDVESRATPGCVMEGDVVMSQPSKSVIQLWKVQRCVGEEVKLRRLHNRGYIYREAIKGDSVTMRGLGRNWDAVRWS